MVVVLGDKVVEAVLLLENVFCNPKHAIGLEHLTIQVVSDSTTILHIAGHVLQSLERHCGASCLGLGHVLLDIEKGGLQIGVVEFIRNTEAKRTELSAFLHN
jgi:hypothetical protein